MRCSDLTPQQSARIDQNDLTTTQQIGDAWPPNVLLLFCASRRLLARVWNYLLNPLHPDADTVKLDWARRIAYVAASSISPGNLDPCLNSPEVETVANGVHARVHGQTILSVWTSNKPQTFKSPPDIIADTLTNARIDRVHRIGKTIVCDITQSTQTTAQFLVHLGMTGRLLVSTPETPVPPHTHAMLTLSGGKELRFVDARRFGRLSIHKELRHAEAEHTEAEYKGPGKEPLHINLEDFISLFRRRRTPIKAALLNQSLLHGVGNIYADEALFRAGIRPRRQAVRLTRAELARLREGLILVLTHAIELGGSSVSDYVDADGVRGFFQLEHRVYMRTAQPCLVCATPIRKITIGGRSTHFCPVCQK